MLTSRRKPLKINPVTVAIITILVTVTGFSFPLHDSGRPYETQVFQLYPTNEPGLYEGYFDIQLFHSTVNVEGVEVDASGYFDLQRFVWIELEWSNGKGENKVTLNSFPTSASYRYKEDNVELFLEASLHGISVRVKIHGQHEGLPTLKFAYYLPY